MASSKIRGLVLCAFPHKEQDRLVRILTAQEGVLFACAPGAGKTGSRHAMSAQPGTLSDFVLTYSKGFIYISESTLIEAFSGLYEEIELLTSAAHILEITTDVCVSTDISSAIFPYVLRTLYALSHKVRDYRLIVSAFEWKMMYLSGYSPDLSICSCHPSVQAERYAFSFSECRLSCLSPACLAQAGQYMVITNGTVEALQYIRGAESSKLFSFKVSDLILSELIELTRRFLCERFEKKYCKMDLLSSANELSCLNG